MPGDCDLGRSVRGGSSIIPDANQERQVSCPIASLLAATAKVESEAPMKQAASTKAKKAKKAA